MVADLLAFCSSPPDKVSVSEEEYSMRAAELIGSLTFRLVDMPIDDPGPGEVQVRIGGGGCDAASEYACLREARSAACSMSIPCCSGMSPRASSSKQAPGVTGFAVGDAGRFEPALYCYHCEFCLSGHHNVCANIRFLSQPRTIRVFSANLSTCQSPTFFPSPPRFRSPKQLSPSLSPSPSIPSA